MLGRHASEPAPDLLVCVVDATNLRLNLRLVLELKRLGRPMLVALNMSDVAEERGYTLNRAALEQALGIPVIRTVAVRSGGERELIEAIDNFSFDAQTLARARARLEPPAVATVASIEATQREVRRVLEAAGYRVPARVEALAKLDRVVLHPVAGPLLLGAVLFLMFQAVFSWAKAPQAWINSGIAYLSAWLSGVLPAGPLRGLLLDGVVAGTGSVLVFLPQILLLFAFILALEDSGYLPRAAFMLDRLMGRVGLSGRAFIPLLSSLCLRDPGGHGGAHHPFRARPPGDHHDRPAHDLLGTPAGVCALDRRLHPAAHGGLHEPARAGAVRAVPGRGGERAGRRAVPQAPHGHATSRAHCLLELPEYRLPHLSNLALGLWERTKIFVGRVGTIILTLMVVLWFLASFPAPPAGATGPAIQYSIAGMLGRALEHVFAPIGFNWQISLALVPGLAAREVAVSSLGTVYAMSGGADVQSALTPVIAHSWSIATGLSLLAWYVFAPQCLSTLAVVKRETNSWRYPLYMAGYLFALAYIAAFITYRVALACGGGVRCMSLAGAGDRGGADRQRLHRATAPGGCCR